MIETDGRQASERDYPLADIAIVLIVSLVAFGTELAAADYLPWGEEARGVIAVLAAAIVALWLTVSRGRSLADLGFVRPKRWWTVPLWVLGIMVVFIVAQGAIPQLLAPMFDLPAPDISRYDYVRGNVSAALALALILPITASIPEEIVYRGFFIERFTSLYGHGRRANALAVLSQSIVFGLIHFQWGLGGIVMTTIMGLVWGVAFLLCSRNLWIVIIAHSAAHILFVLQLYSAPAPL